MFLLTTADQPKIRETAEAFARSVEEQSGQFLAFELSSLATFDAFLSEWLDMASVYDAPADDMVAALTFPLICFIGECLVKNSTATWSEDARNDSDLPVLALPDGKLVDLEIPVAAVLRGQARPFFHQLATELIQVGGTEEKNP